MCMSTETSWLLLISILEQNQWGLSMFVETKQYKTVKHDFTMSILSVGGHCKAFETAEDSVDNHSTVAERGSDDDSAANTKCL